MRLVPSVTRLAPKGMVCAIDHLAANAGVAMLRAGGSAADAAVAAGAVLAITSQHQCGVGGDLFALVHDGAGPPAALNASGRAGSGADPDRLRAEGHRQMPGAGDIRSVPVPGCVDGWVTLHERYGRLALADVLAPAQAYAADGFAATPTQAGAALAVAGLPGGEAYAAAASPSAGAVVRQPGLARALQAIAEGGRAGFYEGEFGDGLLALGAGEYEPEDLARSQADWVEPLAIDAWGHRLWTVPPNSQGYLTLAASWIAAGLDLPHDPDDPLWAHLTIEAARQAAFDRIAVLHEGADGRALLAPERLAPRRDAVNREHAARLGVPARTGDTVFLCAVDADRMGVSLIQSHGGSFGSLLAIPGMGAFLHRRGIGFSLEPGHPAEYGPGRRPPHTLSPALLTTLDGRLSAVIGTMGGDSQPQILVQLLARLLGAGQSPATAIAAGRWALSAGETGLGFDTWDRAGDVNVVIEGHTPASWDDGLAARGHRVIRLAPYSHDFGHAHVITVRDDHLAAASEPRALDGAAAGY
jgi:gamma-glutamyltranspeptidase/glutathione hydrolase